MLTFPVAFDEDGLVLWLDFIRIPAERISVAVHVFVRMRVDHSELLEEQLPDRPVHEDVLIHRLHHGHALPPHVQNQIVQAKVATEFLKEREKHVRPSSERQFR